MTRRAFLGAAAAARLAMLAGLGYQEVELFGPYPFSTPAAQAGWKAAGASLGFAGSGFFDRLDPEVVALEMDVFWTVAGGADPVALLDAYPRLWLYRLMHVKDMTRQARFTWDGDMQDVMALFPEMTTAGAGVLDLTRILGHARRNGVEHFYVEQDLAADPPAQLGASARFLRGLTLTT